MKRTFLATMLFLLMVTICAQGKNIHVEYPFEVRPDSGCIIFTSRIHNDSTLDTIAYINTNGIWHKFANLEDSATIPIIKVDSFFGNSGSNIWVRDNAVFGSGGDSYSASYEFYGGLYSDEGLQIGGGNTNPIIAAEGRNLWLRADHATYEAGTIVVTDDGNCYFWPGYPAGQVRDIILAYDLEDSAAQGLVGIRTNDPQSALHVNGSVRAEDTVFADFYMPDDSAKMTFGDDVNIDSTVTARKVQIKREPFIIASTHLDEDTQYWYDFTATASSSGDFSKYGIVFSGLNYINLDSIYIDSIGIGYEYQNDTVNIDSVRLLCRGFPDNADGTGYKNYVMSTDNISLDDDRQNYTSEYHIHTLGMTDTLPIVPVGVGIYWTNPNASQDCSCRINKYVLYGRIIRGY
jgi:hypothetical protein